MFPQQIKQVFAQSFPWWGVKYYLWREHQNREWKDYLFIYCYNYPGATSYLLGEASK